MSASSGRTRAVVDTNLFVSGLMGHQNAPFRLLELLRSSGFQLLMSSKQFDELSDVLTRPRLIQNFGISPDEVRELFALIGNHAEMISVSETSERVQPQVRDHKDQRILAAALVGDADYLVTGDNDLLVLADDQRIGRLQIVTAATFLAALAAE